MQDAPGEDWRPDGACQIITAGNDGHCNAPPLLKPQGNVSNKRAKGCGTAEETNECRLGRHIHPVIGRKGSGDEACAQHDGANEHGHHNAKTISEPSHQHAAKGKADHGHGVGKCRARAINAEFGLNGRQHHDARPQANATDGGKGERYAKAHPCVAAVGQMACGHCPYCHCLATAGKVWGCMAGATGELGRGSRRAGPCLNSETDINLALARPFAGRNDFHDHFSGDPSHLVTRGCHRRQ